jgi:hypothetical protein
MRPGMAVMPVIPALGDEGKRVASLRPVWTTQGDPVPQRKGRRSPSLKRNSGIFHEANLKILQTEVWTQDMCSTLLFV